MCLGTQAFSNEGMAAMHFKHPQLPCTLKSTAVMHLNAVHLQATASLTRMGTLGASAGSMRSFTQKLGSQPAHMHVPQAWLALASVEQAGQRCAQVG